MKTSSEQIIFRDTQPMVDILDEEAMRPVKSFPPSEKYINFIEVFNLIDKQCKGHITKNDILRFLNKFVLNAKFNVEDLC